MPSVSANGVSLECEQKGTGTPVIFVHGTACDLRSWSAQVDALPNHKTVSYSRRYAWPNSREGDLTDSTVENNAEDLAGLMHEIGAGQAHIVGHSYGGFVSAYFAFKNPEMVKSLTLVNAAVATVLAESTSPSAMLGLLLRMPGIALSARTFVSARDRAVRLIEAGDKEAIVRVFLPVLENNARDLPPKGEAFTRMVLDNARTLKETATPFPRLGKSELSRIKTPTLVISGELSAPWDLKTSELLAKSIAGSESLTIKGASHFCLNDRPTEVGRGIRDFVDKND
ncbi:MAG TPA: alpha/beta hydrolase [Nitrososphaerales archaeon]|nr:alpha/beta hydrolase [Nitrososphaerales archaeon]